MILNAAITSPNRFRLPRCAAAVLLALPLLLLTSRASGQTVDPRSVEFDPSADHYTVLTGGQAAVSRYDFDLYYLGAAQPFQVNNLGKPVPEADGKIRVDFVSFLPSWPLPGIAYEARVNAIGPAGNGDSSPSNAFSFSGACANAVSPSTLAFPAAGGPGNVDVFSGTGCTWSASSSAGWVTVPSGTINGNARMNVNVAPNTTTMQRTATLTAGTASVLVTQAAGGCAFAVSPTNVSAAAVGGTGTLAVTAASGCSWTAASAAAWITVTSGATGSGAGSTGYTMAANTSTSARTGTVTIAGTVVTVTQAGTTSCTTTVSPTSLSELASGASGTIAVTAQTGCKTHGTSQVSWITLIGEDWSGTANVGYTVTPNTATTSRTGTMTFAGKVVTVTQAGVACSFAVSPTTVSAAASGGRGTLGVTAASGCSWTATSAAAWITVTTGATGSGAGSAGYTVAANPSTSPRTGTVTVAGTVVTVTQAGGAACTYTLSAKSFQFARNGGSGSVNVVTSPGCVWTATSNATWVTTNLTAAGTGTVNFTVAKNRHDSTRTGTLTVAGQTVTIQQN